jgi:hypothetical protein
MSGKSVETWGIPKFYLAILQEAFDETFPEDAQLF